METSTISIIIIILTVIAFASDKFSIAVVAMVSALAMGITGCMSFSEIYRGFGSTTVAMVVGMMIIGESLFQTGVAARFGNAFTQNRFIKTEKHLLLMLLTSAAILSMFTSNTAVIAMYIPLINSVSKVSKGKYRTKHFLMGSGMIASIGGASTLIGSTPQLLTQSILLNTEGCRGMNFWELGKVGFPLVLITLIYFKTIGYKIQDKVFDFGSQSNEDLGSLDNSEININKNIIEEEIKDEIEPLKNTTPKWKMLLSLGTMIFVVIGFMSKLWDVGTIALFGSFFLFVTGVLDFKQIFRRLDWQTIVVLGAAQGFAAGLDLSGGGAKISSFAIGAFGNATSPILLLSVLVVITVILTSFMSNTAVAAMMVPIAIKIAFGLDSNPMTFAMTVATASALALATPIGTTSVTQTLIAGYEWNDYVKVGLPLTIILTAALIVLAPIVFGI